MLYEIAPVNGGINELRVRQLMEKTLEKLKVRTATDLLSKMLYNAVIDILKDNVDDYDKKRLKHYSQEIVNRIKAGY